ncbi:hypothetical protein BDB01DRAFT_364038 [Pilobolus umbonatus]|nr:hypothetical protein BDB01DRAFT_364038 [Pilobolus umbonatus]
MPCSSSLSLSVICTSEVVYSSTNSLSWESQTVLTSYQSVLCLLRSTQGLHRRLTEFTRPSRKKDSKPSHVCLTGKKNNFPFFIQHMADSSTPGVKKTKRRFVPVKKAAKPEVVVKKESVPDTTSLHSADPGSSSEPTKTTPIGTIRPEATGDGRLPSIKDGSKNKATAPKVWKCI